MNPGLVAAACLLLAACANGQSNSDGAYQRGVAALAAGQPRTARVELLNAIQARPNDAAARIMQARTLLLLQDGAAAEAELRRAAQLRVPRSRLAHLLAEAALLQGKPEAGLEFLEQSRGAPAAATLRIRARALAALSRRQEAEAAFAEAITLAPTDARLWLDVARFRRSVGDIAAALAAADRAVGLAPGAAQALGLRAELTRSQYGLAASLPWFDAALAIDPRDTNALLERAATQLELGAAAAALTDSRAALAIGGPHPVAYQVQALIAARAGRWALADSLYRRTGGRLDQNPASSMLAAMIELETGNAGGAARRLERLARQQPDNRKVLRLLGLALARIKDPAGTIGVLRPIADVADGDSWTLSLVADAFAQRADQPSAARYRARAARISPQRASLLRAASTSDPRVAVVRTALTTDNPAAAVAEARMVAASSPGAPDAHMLLGDALAAADDPAGAAEAYRRAANLAFSEPVALRLVDALDRSGQADAATAVVRLFLAQNPRSISVQRLAAGRYLAAGQWAAAIRTYEGLRMRLGDRDALLLNNLAIAWSQHGDPARAERLSRRAAALDPANPLTSVTLGRILFDTGRNRAEGLARLQRAAQDR